jgi:Fe-S cluster assembly iron-binding protein IscA
MVAAARACSTVRVRRERPDGDTQVERKGVKLLVDPMSFQYLNGAEIDYREGLEARSS